MRKFTEKQQTVLKVMTSLGSLHNIGSPTAAHWILVAYTNGKTMDLGRVNTATVSSLVRAGFLVLNEENNGAFINKEAFA